ncbi:MAG: hypothetical protein ABI597_00390 [Gammaproteobacteria bacterium]
MLSSIGRPHNSTFTPTAAELAEWITWARDKKPKELQANIKEFDASVDKLIATIVSTIKFAYEGIGTSEEKSVHLFAPESLSSFAGFKMFCVSEKNEEFIELVEKLFEMSQKYKAFPVGMNIEKVGFIYSELEKIYATHLHQRAPKLVNLPAELLANLETIEMLSPEAFIKPIESLQELTEGDIAPRLRDIKAANHFMLTNINNDKYFAEQKLSHDDERPALFYNITSLLYHMEMYLEKMRDIIKIKELDRARNPGSKTVIPDKKNMEIIEELYNQLNALQNDKSKDSKTARKEFLSFHKTMFVRIMLLSSADKNEAENLARLQTLINPTRRVSNELQKFLDSAGEKQHHFLFASPIDKSIDITADLIKDLMHLQDQYMNKKTMTLIEYNNQVKAHYQKSALKLHDQIAKKSPEAQQKKLFELLRIIKTAMGEALTSHDYGLHLMRTPIHVATVAVQSTAVSHAEPTSSTTSGSNSSATSLSNTPSTAAERNSLTVVTARHSRANSSASFISTFISNALETSSSADDGESPRSTRGNTISTIHPKRPSTSTHKASHSVAFNFGIRRKDVTPTNARSSAMFAKKDLQTTDTSHNSIEKSEEKMHTSKEYNKGV